MISQPNELIITNVHSSRSRRILLFSLFIILLIFVTQISYIPILKTSNYSRLYLGLEAANHCLISITFKVSSIAVRVQGETFAGKHGVIVLDKIPGRILKTAENFVDPPPPPHLKAKQANKVNKTGNEDGYKFRRRNQCLILPSDKLCVLSL